MWIIVALWTIPVLAFTNMGQPRGIVLVMIITGYLLYLRGPKDKYGNKV